MELQLRDENGILKFKLNDNLLLHLSQNGLFTNTTHKVKKYKDNTSSTAFTFSNDLVLTTEIGTLYFWKGDYISLSVNKQSVSLNYLKEYIKNLITEQYLFAN